MRALGPWNRRDQRSVLSHQALVDGINANADVSATGDLVAASHPFGRGIIDRRPVTYLDVRLGIVVGFGPPDGQSAFVDEEPTGDCAPDFTDPRYWVAFAEPDADDADALIDLHRNPPPAVSDIGPGTEEATDRHQYAYPVVVTNLAEKPAGTHLLPTDGTCEVIILLVRDVGDAGGVSDRWVMRVEPQASVRYGTLVEAWAPGTNTVTLQPSTSGGEPLLDDDDEPLPTVSAYIIAPINRKPAYLLGEVDDVFPYEQIGPGAYMLKNPQTTPIPVDKYETIQNQSSDPDAPRWVADLLQGHP